MGPPDAVHAHVPAGIGQSFLHGSCQALAADTCPRNRGNSGEPCCQVANSWDSFPGDMTQRLQHIRERAPEDPETIFKAVCHCVGPHRRQHDRCEGAERNPGGRYRRAGLGAAPDKPVAEEKACGPGPKISNQAECRFFQYRDRCWLGLSSEYHFRASRQICAPHTAPHPVAPTCPIRRTDRRSPGGGRPACS